MTRNQRKAKAKRAFIERQSMRLIREDKARIGKVRDAVMATVKANLSKVEDLCPIEEKAWLGKGCSSVYQPGRAIAGQRYGTGKTLSVAKGPVKNGRLRGGATDVTY